MIDDTETRAACQIGRGAAGCGTGAILERQLRETRGKGQHTMLTLIAKNSLENRNQLWFS